ncbi:MAG: FixH family protein [Planctomycetes bacterium]|jgi:hypothetical protein|nr:FixH family protein [Planctomycetota bacterium]
MKMMQRFLVFLAIAPMTILVPSGCSKSSTDGAPDVKVELRMSPDPPTVGQGTATVTLTDKDGGPLRGATLKLEGNMNHAGMKPVFADAKELDPGKYEASVNLTMGGDWFFLIDAVLADGRRLKRKIDVPGVKSR